MLVSKITPEARTTLPMEVQTALALHPGDTLAWVIEGDRVIIRRAPTTTPAADEDPALVAFLNLLERDITAHPERLQPVTPHLFKRLCRATEGVQVDPYDVIEGPVDL